MAAPPPAKKPPPPLPPRQSTAPSPVIYADPPPTYDSIVHSKNVAAGPWETQDPRSSSSQSLAPSENNEQHERRKLLLIYLHGFMGNETSFRSFPAHVHHLLTVLLAATHVVHTKVYPRYRSKRNIRFARDDFSAWLEPHEDPTTDVVLLGHSMGGLLAAEVVLMPPAPPASRALKHRILGSINFDVPFLGMHPGVVRSGLASIFNPVEPPKDQTAGAELSPVASQDGMSPISPSLSARTDTLWSSDHKDPNYNTPFPNDVKLAERQGWRKAWHFVNKHSGELGKATKQLVSSHMEFGGAMANYGELKLRYARIRALEEADEGVRKSVVREGATPARARFINYYTASTGKPKKPKVPEGSSSAVSVDTTGGPSSSVTSPTGTSQDEASVLSIPASATNDNRSFVEHTLQEQSALTATPTSTELPGADAATDVSGTSTPLESPASHDDVDIALQSLAPEPYEAPSDEDWNDAAETLTMDDPKPGDDGDDAPASPLKTENPTDSTSLTSTLSRAYSLPPIPDPPSAPPALDTSYIADAETRKLVEKEHSRAVKAYEKAIKDRQKAIAEREKLEEKRARSAEKARKDAAKAEQKAEVERVRAGKKAEVQRGKEGAKLAKAGKGGKGKGRGGGETAQAEGEERRLAEERVRVENEGRRMRGEAPLPPPRPRDDDDDDEEEVPPTTDHGGSQTTPAVTTPSGTPASDPREPLSSEDEQQQQRADAKKAAKGPPKDRMFCLLPPKDSQGERDPCWVRVFMKDVDEVGAHCGLFFVDERYERLVGDVAERVEGWVHEDAGRRAARGI
ncbi:hypothetical protein LTR53_012924 [Teratosphaeriaceae sp. CCFEE 6253]|nr:hypothetical protein LTR53_012924 [Teratosphaeriaceae sp. CCFEE 6253]